MQGFHVDEGNFHESKTLLRIWLRKYGVVKLTIAITVISIILSLAITIDYAINTSISQIAIMISSIAPALIAPFFEYRSLVLLHQLDKAEQQLRVLSITDDLTGTYNRRHGSNRLYCRSRQEQPV